MTFTWKQRPESEFDCFICAIFARQRSALLTWGPRISVFTLKYRRVFEIVVSRRRVIGTAVDEFQMFVVHISALMCLSSWNELECSR